MSDDLAEQHDENTALDEELNVRAAAAGHSEEQAAE